MDPTTQKAKEVFLSLIAKVSPEDWDLHVDQVCAEDESLRQQVLELLHAHRREDSFLERPASGLAPTLDQPITEKPGTQIGPYKLLQQIGEGGMGVVYMAEQTEPVERRVALKIIKPGMDTRQVIARFEAERQALAMMDHPNIAKVLDAGTTDSGRPYFVMELVKGVPITQYCDEKHLTPKERLALFVPVCQAVQHAHQKGIIHRDIKPSNVMVCNYDDHPMPKVIDFGVAKATSRTLTKKTMFTQVGQVVGTLEYMSPEQAQVNQLDVDTRSDIYSLGVVLYELLTGETPFDRERLRSAAFDEMLRIIREEEPSRPSTKVSSSQSLPSIAANRRIEPAKLGSMIRGELDWIVLKAMEKDRGRRYETASKFAEDIENYLNDEPIVACPPSARYRFRKFARRNKTALTTAAMVAVSLLVGTGVATWQAIRATGEAGRANRAEALAEERYVSEESARREAENATQRANDEAAVAFAVNDFLQNDLLWQADVANQLGGEAGRDPDVKVRTLLDRAAKTVAARFADRPRVEAAVRATIGDAYSGLGLYQQAELQLERAHKLHCEVLGEKHPDTLRAADCLGRLYHYQGRHAEAEALLQATLEMRRRLLGPEHPHTIVSQINLANLRQSQGRYAEAERLHSQTYDICLRVLGPEERDTLLSQACLASVYHDQCRYEEAESLYLATLEAYQRVLGPDHPLTLTTQNDLALLYQILGRYAESEKLYKTTLQAKQYVQGPDHPGTLTVQTNLAGLYEAQGRYDEAEKLYKATLDARQRVWGPDHPQTLTTRNNLALLYVDMGRYDEAEKLLVSDCERCKQRLGPQHPITLTTQNNLALLYHRQSRYEESAALDEATLETRRRVIGPEHLDTLTSQNNLASTYKALLRYDEAEKLQLDTLEAQKHLFGPDHPSTLTSQHNLGELYFEQGRYAEAQQLLDATLEARRRVLGPKHVSTLASQESLGKVYVVQGRHKEAQTLLKSVLDAVQRTLGHDHPKTLISLANLAWSYHQQGDYDEAEKLYKAALTTQQRVLAAGHSDTLATANYLTGLYVSQWRYAEAAELLEAMLQAFQNRHSPNHDGTLRIVYNLAYAKMEVGQTDDALALFMRIGDSKLPFVDGNRYYHQLALCYLALDREAEYSQVCRQMLEAFRDPPNRETPWTCVLAKGAVDDWRPVVEHARRVVAQDGSIFHRTVLGAALWRAGETDEAVELLREAAAEVEDATEAPALSPAYVWFTLSMVCHERGDVEGAKLWFARAERWTTQVIARHESADGPKVPWIRRLTLTHLCDEAASVLGTKPPKPKQRDDSP